ncbi:chemotaxis protein CheD [Atopococcus tabaci]|uniref:chemotaxis protein CheD n=1 Tax=Atopococcus tabaci TaxID=269774 RepID=UPI000425D9EF|nr:chemotaxis protein CheD [Atopococcus tabaci]
MNSKQTAAPEQVKVGIADYKITQAPHSLITIGLGSCVGIALYDTYNKIGGLVHIMLPDSQAFKDTSKWVKFADLAIPKVAEELSKGTNAKLVAKIAGGASMFQFNTNTKGLQIGERNIEAVKQTLGELKIPLLGEHTGGNMGRTMMVDLDTFDVTVRMVNRELHQI